MADPSGDFHWLPAPDHSFACVFAIALVWLPPAKFWTTRVLARDTDIADAIGAARK